MDPDDVFEMRRVCRLSTNGTKKHILKRIAFHLTHTFTDAMLIDP